MARLSREWGYQWTRRCDDRWKGPEWVLTRRLAERLVENGPGVGEERRLVSRVVSDPEVVRPVMVCPVDGGLITTSQGRHAPMCIRAVCRYEGVGVVDRG